MEEQETKNTENGKKECKCALNPFWKYLFLGLAVFLGTFCAAYAMIDWHMKSYYYAPFQPDEFISGNEKFMQNEFRKADKFFNEEEKFIQSQTGIVQTAKKDGKYTIIINLSPFDNNADNVSINTDKNSLDISAKSENKSKNEEHISNFQQSYVFGDDVNLSKMTKTIKDGNIIITIPLEENKTED